MIGIKVGSDVEPAVRSLRSATPELRLRLLSAMELVGGELVARMQSHAARLERRTGKLARSFYHKVSVKQGGDVFVLTSGLARRAFYGGFQDRGIPTKTVDVKGYARGNKSGNVREGRRRIASGVAFVTAYRRQMHLQAEPFIGVSLEEMRAAIVRELQLAVSGALGG